MDTEVVQGPITDKAKSPKSETRSRKRRTKSDVSRTGYKRTKRVSPVPPTTRKSRSSSSSALQIQQTPSISSVTRTADVDEVGAAQPGAAPKKACVADVEAENKAAPPEDKKVTPKEKSNRRSRGKTSKKKVTL